MIDLHKPTFITFHPSDLRAALRTISQLEAQFPDRTFTGRHNLHDKPAVLDAIDKATLTLVLETSKTMLSRRVQDDIAASLDKDPPNVILRIQLELTPSGDGGPLGKRLSERGVEVVPCEINTVADAVTRSDTAYRVQPKLRDAAVSGASAGHGCNR